MLLVPLENTITESMCLNKVKELLKAKMNWQQLKQYHLNPPTHALARKADVQKAYDRYRAIVDNVGLDVYNRYLQHMPMALSPSLFPYDLQPEIQHWIVWLRPHINLQRNLNSVSKELDCNGVNHIVFENSASHKSIPEVQHFHLFVQQHDAEKAHNIIINAFYCTG